MAPETKEKALSKVDKVQVKIGYPDKWKDYSDLVIEDVNEGGSFYQNMMNVTKWNYDDRISRFGKSIRQNGSCLPKQ